MSDGRERDSFAGVEAVADWFRQAEPEIGPHELDRIKRRALTQASQRPSNDRGPAWLAGVRSLTKGVFMRERPRPLLTLLLVLGFGAIASISALGVAGSLPGQGPQFDAAQSQYDEDDGGNPGGGNGKSDDDDGGGGGGGRNNNDNDDGGGDPPVVVPPGLGGLPVANACGLFARNFRGVDAQRFCSSAVQLALSGQVTAQQACAQFSNRLRRVRRTGGRGFVRIRSNRAACLRAVQLAQTGR